MEDIITNDWDLCDISSDVITYNEVVYQRHSEDSKLPAKAFLWHECMHVASEYEKRDKSLVQYERLKVQSTNQTGGILVLGTEKSMANKPGGTTHIMI